VALHRTRADLDRRRGVRLTAAAVVVGVAFAGLVLAAPRAFAESRLDQMFRNRALVEHLGPFGYHAYDAWNYARMTIIRPPVADRDVEEARAWFESRAPLRRGVGPAFAAARGLNIVVVQVESLQDFAVDFRVGDQEVMPHLRRWSADTVRFTNVTDQTNEGRTSDAEFTTLASLLPLDHGAVAFRYPGDHYVGVPRVLAEQGYGTLSAVAFEPGFWNRAVMHPAYGFQRTLFESDFTMTEQIGWGLNDYDFLQQMVPRLEQLPQPFCAWLITLSLHHPFDDFPSRHKVMKLGSLEGTSFGNYLHTMRFFDQALDDFISALASRGLLDKTMIVVFGDHDAGFARTPRLARTIGTSADEPAWQLLDRIPWFIRLPHAGDRLPHVVDRPAGQTDFGPTLLALAGIDPAALPYVGRNVLGEPDDPPLPRPYGDWLDGAHLFLSHGAEHTGACFDRKARTLLDAAACAAEDARARKARDVSRLVVVNGLQEQMRSSLVQSTSR